MISSTRFRNSGPEVLLELLGDALDRRALVGQHIRRLA